MKTDMLPKDHGAASFMAACFVAMLSNAIAAPLKPSPEDRYIVARDAAIEKLQPIFDAGNADDAANKAEDAVIADLRTQMTAILGEHIYKGFGPAKLNLDTLYKGDEGFGMLDGLRFDAETGKNGEKAGSNDADGKYVEPKAHIIVTTPTMFTRWQHGHKDWLDKGLKKCRSRSARRSGMAVSIPRRSRPAPPW
jgi:hypothetical protein